MGNFRIVVDAVGGHGCQRASDRVDQTKPIYWCGQQGCPDCITREFVKKMAETQSSVKAQILHWPDANGNVIEETVVDDIVIEHPRVQHYKNSDGTEGHYVVPMNIYRKRSKPM